MTREESRQFEKKILEECKGTVDGATDDDVNNVLEHEPPKTQSAKCLAACGQQKIGIVCIHCSYYLIEPISIVLV